MPKPVADHGGVAEVDADGAHESGVLLASYDATANGDGSAAALGKLHKAKTSDAGSESDADSDDIEVYNDADTLYPGYEAPAGAEGRAPPAHPHGTEIHWATMAQKRALWWRNVLITGMFILSWYAFATLLSMYNKWMFSPELYGFSYPLFVTGCHMGVQFICAGLIRYFLPQFRPAERPSRREYGTRIFPTAVSTGADIGLSNLSLKTITLSLYTMCKSSALIFVLMFAFLFRLERYSLRLVSVIALISGGVFLMVFNTTDVSIPGIIMVFSASAVGGLRWALTQLVMDKRSMGLSNPFATIYWLAPPMGVVLLLVSAIVESWRDMLFSEYFANPLIALRSIGVILLPGAIAFAMVASEYFVIQRAGVVPLSIAGIFKEVSTITFSAWIFGDKLTMLNMLGCAVTVFGIGLYSFHKYQKSMKEEVPLDDDGNVVATEADDDERRPLRHSHSRAYSHASAGSGTRRSLVFQADADEHGTTATPAESVHMTELRRGSHSDTDDDERVARLRDDFEGWDSVGRDDDAEYDDADPEVDDDDVALYRAERTRSRWQQWWDRPV